MSDEINGWKPPVIYDTYTDSHRIATQRDIDEMVIATQRDIDEMGAAIKALIVLHNAAKRAMADCDTALEALRKRPVG